MIPIIIGVCVCVCVCVAVLDHPSLLKCVLLVLVLNTVVYGSSYFLEGIRDKMVQRFLILE